MRVQLLAVSRRPPAWALAAFAEYVTGWQLEGDDVLLLIGGADGLAPDCLARAEACWALSALTLSHVLVRVLVAEQLYRTVSVNAGHPYHR